MVISPMAWPIYPKATQLPHSTALKKTFCEEILPIQGNKQPAATEKRLTAYISVVTPGWLVISLITAKFVAHSMQSTRITPRQNQLGRDDSLVSNSLLKPFSLKALKAFQ